MSFSHLIACALLLLVSCAGVSRAATHVYVANEYSDTVSVIDASDNSIVATVPVGRNPFGIAGQPGGSRIYVTSHGDHAVHVVDARDNSVVDTINLPWEHFLMGASGIALGPGGRRAYVSDNSHNLLLKLNLARSEVVDEVQMDGGPKDVLVHPNGKTIYVLNTTGGSVSVVDVSSFSISETIETNGVAHFGALSADGRSLYLSERHLNKVTVIDTENNMVSGSIGLPHDAADIALDVQRSRLYAIGSENGELSVIELPDGEILETKAFGNKLKRIEPHPSRPRAYVSNRNDSSISVVDTNSFAILETVHVGALPGDIAVVTGVPVREFPKGFGYRGSWYQPSSSGQGFSFEVLPGSSDGEASELVAYWFTYARNGGEVDKQQRWFISQGPIEGEQAVIDVFRVTGGQFDRATQVTETVIGKATVTFQDCTRARFEYMLDLNQDGERETEGAMDLVRLSEDVFCESLSGGD